MSRQPRFEVVRSDGGWHARFRAANGRIVWTTEVYTRFINADRAVAMLWEDYDAHLIRILDERGQSDAHLMPERGATS